MNDYIEIGPDQVLVCALSLFLSLSPSSSDATRSRAMSRVSAETCKTGSQLVHAREPLTTRKTCWETRLILHLIHWEESSRTSRRSSPENQNRKRWSVDQTKPEIDMKACRGHNKPPDSGLSTFAFQIISLTKKRAATTRILNSLLRRRRLCDFFVLFSGENLKTQKEMRNNKISISSFTSFSSTRRAEQVSGLVRGERARKNPN